MERQQIKRNFILYIIREACYTSAGLFATGTLVQLFLSVNGASSEQISIFNALMQCISLAGLMLFSTYAERHPDAVRQASRFILYFSLAFLGFLPIVWLTAMPVNYLVLSVCLIAGIQCIFASFKSVLEYKLFYEIIDIEDLGKAFSITGLITGIVGVGVSGVAAFLLSHLGKEEAFFCGFIIAFILGMCSFLSNRMMVSVRPFVKEGKKNKVLGVVSLFKRKDFYVYIFPNTVRGISQGLLISIVLFAREKGLSVSGIANLAVVGSLASLAANCLYLLLKRNIENRTICIWGSVLACAIILLPFGHAEIIFLIIYFIASTGKILLDTTIPAVVADFIDPEISGVYNAWRNAISTMATAGSAYLLGAFLGTMPMFVFCLICGIGYVIAGLWYCFGTNWYYD